MGRVRREERWKAVDFTVLRFILCYLRYCCPDFGYWPLAGAIRKAQQHCWCGSGVGHRLFLAPATVGTPLPLP